jgi:ubiquinol-cytochrome c reductase cytochrome b subunit
VQRTIVGGVDYGHHTLTRFFALHAGVLPASIVALVVGHIYLFRRHGITPKQPLRKPDAAFWPDQVLKDAVACGAVLATVLFLIVLPRLRDPHAAMGAELGAPADPSEAFSAARPEWYFLFLFQFLKYFPGESEIFGAMVIPGIFMFVLFLMPIIGQWKLGHRFNILFLFALLAGAGLLTYLAKAEDRGNAIYQAAVKDADASAERIKELAKGGIPPTGALTLLKDDPITQGPKLFAARCASCHRYGGTDGTGLKPTDAESASDLKGFGSREWLARFLTPEHVAGPEYFGGTKFKAGKMVKFVQKDVAGFDAEKKQQLEKVIKALSAEAQLPAQSSLDKTEAATIAQGTELFRSEAMRCGECHQFHKKDEDATAPDLTGWASSEWLAAIIQNPKHPRFYGSRNDRMPAFGEEKILDERQIGILVKWLRGEENVTATAQR